MFVQIRELSFTRARSTTLLVPPESNACGVSPHIEARCREQCSYIGSSSGATIPPAATVINAQGLVHQQAKAGYDFIKIHNSLFSAIFRAARAERMDVVGHIPNEIKIAEAIAAGMRTNEHFGLHR